ncbi:MAG: ABC transporter permease [Defluviitaleaceae bacterium]|nr:ABC transporter permease [Defluviitaleaceae bacterium]
MKIMNRANISLFKNLGKTITLLFLIIILGTLAMGAILAENALTNTVDHLRRSLPPIIALGSDEESLNELYTLRERSQGYAAHLFEFLTRDQIHQIGSLPYVRYYDYSISAMPRHFGWNVYGVNEQLETSFVMFHGVSNPEVIYIEEGLMTLREGRTFTTEEMLHESLNEIAPVLISYELATLNQLVIGSIFEMYIEHFVLPVGANIPEGGFIGLLDEEIWDHPYNNWEDKAFKFEVVGIFELAYEATEQMDFWNRMNILNTLYAPNWRTHQMFTLGIASDFEFQAIFNADFIDIDRLNQRLTMNEPFWILYDILYFEAFQAAASPFLPEFWAFENLASTFNHVHESTSVIRHLAHRAVWFSAGASTVILSLLITLYLKDRRQELGIYLALGERKLRIVMQVLIEVFMVATIGFIIAVLITSVVAPEISQHMLRNELIQERRSQAYWEPVNVLETRGFGRELTIDEAMKAFDVSLNPSVIMLYLLGGFITVGLSTIVPVLFVLELSPKEILMSGKIE